MDETTKIIGFKDLSKKTRAKRSSILPPFIGLTFVVCVSYLGITISEDEALYREVEKKVMIKKQKLEDLIDPNAAFMRQQAKRALLLPKVPKGKEKPKALPQIIEKPYQNITKSIAPKSLGPLWSVIQEELWRKKIESPSSWQRYNTVWQIRAARREGSEAILFQALKDKKFWTRSRAAIALADFGFEIEEQDLHSIFQKTHPDLIGNFFKRFFLRATPGAKYLMKAALNIVSPRARLSILKTLRFHKDDHNENEIIFFAARFDPDTNIRLWASQQSLKISHSTQQDYLKTLLKKPKKKKKEKKKKKKKKKKNVTFLELDHQILAMSKSSRIHKSFFK